MRTRTPRANRLASARRGRAGGAPAYLVLIAVTLLSALPLYWTVVAASRTNAEIAASPPALLPGPNLLANVRKSLDQVNMYKAILNSVIVSSSVTFGTVFFCTLAGYAFARLRFRGRTLLFGLVIGTMMIPSQFGVIPLFMLIADLHWVDQLQSVILPSLVSAFGVFFMRQYLIWALPVELIEAGVLDGASSFRVFRSIVLPVARPAMAVLGMLTFLQAWNDFFWPILALTSNNPTVQVALRNLGGGYVPDQSIIMAGTLVGMAPVVVVFALLGRYIVDGVLRGAVKG